MTIIMKIKVYYEKDSRGYWRFWSGQDECNYVYLDGCVFMLQDVMIFYVMDYVMLLNNFEFQCVEPRL